MILGNAEAISIHALLAESDFHLYASSGIDFAISIHALLAESDSMLISLCCGCFDFYPRSPCGERPLYPPVKPLEIGISIHALLAESDPGSTTLTFPGFDFYPRSPCGERPMKIDTGNNIGDFYPRSPCGERLLHAVQIVVVEIFLSTLSLRRATPATRRHDQNNMISIHALLAESDILGRVEVV